MKQPKQAPLGTGLIILSSFFYASYGIWTTLIGDFMGGYTASALRSLLVLLILVPIALLVRHFQPLRLRKNWKYLVGLLLSALFIWGPLYYAILHAGVGLALTVNYAAIVIGMLFFGWLMAREKMTRLKLISALLGITGLALVYLPSGIAGVGLLALGAATLSGLAGAANAVIAKKISYNATQTTLFVWLTSVIANVLMAIVFAESIPTIELRIEYFYLLLFAIASVLASWLLIRGVKLIDAGIAGILGLLEIVFAILFGIIFFHEQPGVIALIGAGVIIVAAAVPYMKRRRIASTS